MYRNRMGMNCLQLCVGLLLLLLLQQQKTDKMGGEEKTRKIRWHKGKRMGLFTRTLQQSDSNILFLRRVSCAPS